MAVVTSSWATLRFRRSKDVKGWALLGIPQALYPVVMQPLFERQARFIEKHDRGGFVNVLFEAPVALAARLALAFPAPPSCEPLVVNQAGNRLLYGRFAESAKARPQAQESDAWPGLKLLQGKESFWQVVMTLSSVATLPLDRLQVPDDSPAKQRDAQVGFQVGVDESQWDGEGFDEDAADEDAADEDEWEEDEWEENDWEEEPGETPEEEDFEDVWDMDESADFWADVPAKPASLVPPAPEPANCDRRVTQPARPQVNPLVPPKPPELPKPPKPFEQSQQPETIAPVTPAVGRYRSGLVPHASDAGSLQVYNSGGLTIADAIARSRQQEEAAEAIAQQAQRRRVKLPFEPSPPAPPPRDSAIQRAAIPSWSYNSAAPQLPEETWAAARAAESAQPGREPEAVDWGYYDESGLWVSCDPVMATPPPMEGFLEANGSLDVNASLAPMPTDPVPTDIICLPVGEENHGPLLLQGVAVWNDWRRANPHIRPNLRGAYLDNLDLAGADLHDVDLRFAFLFRADLREADLSLALLFGADLIRADLGGASLWGAALGGAYLSYANLAGADLTQADLRGVYWQGAILAGAIMPDGRWFDEQY